MKKITPQSLRMSGEQKLKEGDEVVQRIETTTAAHLLFFTDRQQAYKARCSDFEDSKASVLGEYLPVRLGMEEGETPLFMAVTLNYRETLLIFFQNGKAARIPLSAYETKTNRRKLVGAFNDKSAPVQFFCLGEEQELAVLSTDRRLLLVNSAQISEKTTKSTAGVTVMSLKKNRTVEQVRPAADYELANPGRYRVRTLPGAGAILRGEDTAEQTSFSEEAR